MIRIVLYLDDTPFYIKKIQTTKYGTQFELTGHIYEAAQVETHEMALTYVRWISELYERIWSKSPVIKFEEV